MKTVLNDLYDYGMKIYQLEDGFKFSLDSLLLAEFVKVKNSKQVIVDFCTGNASIPLVLSTKYSNKIYGIEIQKEIYDLGQKSVSLNKKEEQIKLYLDNILNCYQYFHCESVDIITCNPPYFKHLETSLVNNNELKAIARHEIKIDLENLIKIASMLLKNMGSFYLVHRSERLEELTLLLNKYNFHLKKLVPVYTIEKKNAPLILIEAVKNSNIGLKILSAVYINKIKTFKNIF